MKSKRKGLSLKMLVVVILASIVVAYALHSNGLLPLGVIGVGFEGAKCNFYGADFEFADWQGCGTLHRYQDAESILVQHEAYGFWDRIKWGSYAVPNDLSIVWEYKHAGTGDAAMPELGIHIEQNLAFEEVNRQGDPIGYNQSDPASRERINVIHKYAEKILDDDTHVQYRWTAEVESYMIVPTEFWLGFNLVPSNQQTGGTDSGWREGTWSGILLWFRLDFSQWDLAYNDPWLNNPVTNVFDTPYQGYIINREQSQSFRGGFPVAMWVQGWERAGWSNYAGQTTYPIWVTTRGDQQNQYTMDQMAELKDILMAQTRFSPQPLLGNWLNMFTDPSASFSYEFQQSDFSVDPTNPNSSPLLSKIKSFDTSQMRVMYFPLNVINYGSHTEGHWQQWWRVYYPSVYYRIRALYGLYGTFTYLWTEELAKDPSINYPPTFERDQTLVIHTTGAIGDFWTWLSNPQVWLTIVAIVIVAIVIIVTVTNPGMWSAIMSAQQQKQAAKSRSSKHISFPDWFFYFSCGGQ